jgi:hypothetical protein
MHQLEILNNRIDHLRKAAEAPPDDDDTPRAWLGPGIIALVSAAIPFRSSFVISSTFNLDGHVTEIVTRDFVALAGGGVGLLAGGLSVALALKAGETRGNAMTAGALAIALGAYHLLRGYGML